MPLATPSPAAMPASEAPMPMASASPTTAVSTCRREAPRARSMANSRRRWATVMEKALKMMKAPTKTAHAGEREQHRLEERVERRRPRVGGVGRGLRAGLDLDRRGQRGPDAAGERGVGDARLGGDVDGREAALHAVPALHVGERRGDHDRAAQRRLVAEGEDTGHAHRRDAGGRRDLDGVADTHVVLVGEALVDGHVAGGARGVAGDARGLIERPALGRHDERGGAVGLDGLTVDEHGAQTLGVALGLGDAGDGAHRGQGRGGEARRRGRGVAERLLGADHHRRALERAVVDVGEPLVDLVGEHVGAGHHGHAEDDRQGGEDGAQRAAREAADS